MRMCGAQAVLSLKRCGHHCKPCAWAHLAGDQLISGSPSLSQCMRSSVPPHLLQARQGCQPKHCLLSACCRHCGCHHLTHGGGSRRRRRRGGEGGGLSRQLGRWQ